MRTKEAEVPSPVSRVRRNHQQHGGIPFETAQFPLFGPSLEGKGLTRTKLGDSLHQMWERREAGTDLT